MGVKQFQFRILYRRKNIVKQEADPDAAIGRTQEAGGEDLPGSVAFHQEILHIDTFLGAVNQSEPRPECIGSRNQWEES